MVTATKEQIAIGKRLRQLRNKSRGGMTFKGSKGVGKTLMVGVMNKKPSKGTKARPAHRHSPPPPPSEPRRGAPPLHPMPLGVRAAPIPRSAAHVPGFASSALL